MQGFSARRGGTGPLWLSRTLRHYELSRVSLIFRDEVPGAFLQQAQTCLRGQIQVKNDILGFFQKGPDLKSSRSPAAAGLTWRLAPTGGA